MTLCSRCRCPSRAAPAEVWAIRRKLLERRPLNRKPASMSTVAVIARTMADFVITGGTCAACVASTPIKRQPNKVKRSIRRSISRLLVAVDLLMPIANGNTRARTTSPRRSGNTLFIAMEPRNGAEQLRLLVVAPEACNIRDQRKMRSAYPKESDALLWVWLGLLLVCLFFSFVVAVVLLC